MRGHSPRHTTRRLRTALDTVNGRRRERILHLQEVAQVVREALTDGLGYTTGGSVANSYGYRAYTTMAAAVGVSDLIAIGVAIRDANAGPITWIGAPPVSHAKKIIAWQAGLTWAAMSGDWVDIVITRDEATGWLRSLRPRRVTGRATPRVAVTMRDSIASGNCQSVSRRVRRWFPGRSSVPAQELLAEIDKREPTLRSFAVRAIEAAQRRGGAQYQ
jgi:hypothetical protein